MPRRAFGSLRQVGETWYVRYRLNGREYWKRAGSRRNAERLAALLAVELERGEWLPPAAQRTTFEDLMDLVEADYQASERRSLARVHVARRALARAFAGMRAQAITRDRINRYVAERRAEGKAPNTISNELAILRRGFRLAQAAQLVRQIPTFPPRRGDHVRKGFFEDADLAVLLPALPPDVAAAAEFAYLTGWRRGEICGLTWKNVDFGNQVVRLEPGTTKNAEGREFPFGEFPRLRTLLERQYARVRALERELHRMIPWVFCTFRRGGVRPGGPLRDFTTAWRNALNRAARDERGVIVRPHLLGRVFHDFRRSAVRNLERAGVPRSVAMRLTGHRTESVYRRYAIVAAADLRAGVARLARNDEPRVERGGKVAAWGDPAG